MYRPIPALSGLTQVCSPSIQPTRRLNRFATRVCSAVRGCVLAFAILSSTPAFAAVTVSIGSPSPTITNNGPVDYIITYTGAKDVTLTAADVTLNTTGGATGTISVSGAGKTNRTVTIDNITGNGTIGISLAANTAQDAAGNPAPAAGPSATFTVDNIAPTISVGAPSTTLTRTGPVTYTVTYSGANTVTLASGNVTLNRTGTANGTVTVSGTGTTTRTVTISSITGDGTIGISIAAGTASDTAGNTAAASGASATFTVDNTAPGISISAPSPSATNSGPITYTITYTGASSVTLANGNVTLNSTGGASGSVAVSGSGTATRTVTISSVSGNGTLGISIAAGTATDAAGNSAAAAGPSTTCTVDNIAPTNSIGAPSVTTTNTGPVTYTITYTGASAVTLANGNVTLNKTGTANGTVAVSGSGTATRTVTISSITGDGTLGISIAAGTATDAAGNASAAAGPSTTFTVDNTAPTISIGAPSATDTKSGPVTFTISYTGATSVTLANANVTLNRTGTANGTAAVSGSGTSTRTVTISSITGDGTIGISIAAGTATDGTNTAAAAGPSTTFNVDNTAPGVSISVPSLTATDTGPVTYTITYTGASSVTLANANVTLNRTGTANGSVAVSGSGTSTRTVTISGVVGDGTIGISIAAGTATDIVGNSAAAAGPSTTFSADNTPPTNSIGAPSATTTRTGPVTYTITYTGASSVTLASGDVTLNKTGTANGSVAVSGSGTATRTVTISSITGDGTLGISIAAGSASDAAGNTTAAAGPSTTFTVDNTPPAISIGAPSVTDTRTGPVTFTITYTGASAVTLANANVTLNKTGSANGTVAVSGSGTATRTVTISSISGDGTLGISIAAGTASDAAGNTAASAGPSTTFNADNTAPGISIGAPSDAATTAGPVTYTITYTGASSVTLVNANVTLNKTGSANGTVSVSGSGTGSRTVTISSITGNGTLGISIASGTASDAAGNNAAAAGPSTTFTVDNTPPTISIGAPTPANTQTGPVTFTVLYTGANSVTLGPGDITLNTTGTANGTVGVSGSGTASRTVTISGITGEGTLGISIAAATASDAAGNSAGAAGPSATSNIDITAPTATITLLDSNPTRTNKLNFEVIFSESVGTSFDETDISVTGTLDPGGSTSTKIVSGSGTTFNVEIKVQNGATDGTVGIIVGTAVFDLAGNAFGGLASPEMYTVDNTPPTAVITLTDPNPTNLDAVNFGVAFSETVTPTFTAADVTVTGTLAAGCAIVVSGTDPNYVVTLTPSNPNADGTLGITIGTGVQDLAGNTFLGAASPSLYTIDNTPPAIVISAPSVAFTPTGPVTYTITYGGASSVMLAAGDISLNRTDTADGTAGVSGSGNTTRTVTITGTTGDGTIGITLAAGTAVDAAGNSAVSAGPSATFQVDNVSPTATITLTDPSPTSADSANFAVDFSEFVGSSFSAADVTPSGTLASGAAVLVSGTDPNYVVTVTPSDPNADGTLGIAIGTAVADLAGNAFAGASSPSDYTINNTSPTVGIGSPSVSSTNTGPVDYTVTYSNADVVTLQESDISLNATGDAAGTLSLSGSGNDYTVTISSITGNGTLGISIAAGTASKLGLFAPAAGPSATVTVDNVAPGATIALTDPNPTTANAVNFTVDFDEAVGSSFDATDVTVTGTLSFGATVGVSGTDPNYTVIVTPADPDADGTIGIAVSTSVADLAGNAYAGGISPADYTIDNTGPTLFVGAPSLSLTNAGPVSFTVTYTDASAITLAAGDITLNKSGSADGTIDVTGSGTTTRTVTISGISGDGSLGISIQSGTAADSLGNLSLASSASATFEVDNIAPTATIDLNGTSPTNADSVSFAIVFDQGVNPTFTSADITVTGTLASGALAAVIGAGPNYTVTVTPADADADGTIGITVGTSVTDPAGNAYAGGASPSEYTIDNTAPTISIDPPSETQTNTGPVTYTINYTGADSVTLANANITLNRTSSADGVINVTGTGTASRIVTISSITGNGTLGISIGPITATDEAGNGALSAGPSTTFSVDNNGPTVGLGLPSVTETSAGPVSYTVTYTDANAVTLSPADITLNTTGTATGVVSVTGSGTATRTVTLSSITGTGTLGISIAPGTATDTVGNGATAGGPSVPFTVDNTAPTAVIALTGSNPTSANALAFSVTFDESIGLTFTEADVTVTGTLASGAFVVVSGASPIHTVTVTPADPDANGTIGITIGTAITDAVGNAYAGGSSPASYTIDNSSPSVDISAPSLTQTNVGPVSYTITYSGASNVTLLDTDVVLNLTGTATGSVAVTGSGTTSRTVTISGISGEGTIGISISAGTATNSIGTPATGAGPGAVFEVDNDAPTATIALGGPSPTDADSVSFTVNFDEDVTGFSSSDVTATGTLGSGSVVIVSGLDDTYTVTVTPANPNANGTLGISIGTGLTDLFGNAFGGAVSPQDYTFNNTTPTIAIGNPSPAVTKFGPVEYEILYSSVDAVTLDLSDITLNTTLGANGTLSLSGSGNAYTVTISDITGNGTLSISIAAGTASFGSTQLPAAGPSIPVLVDRSAPAITLHGTELVKVALGETYTDPGAVAFDNADGDLTNSIVVESDVNTAVIGRYFVTYKLEDLVGNSAQVQRTVLVVFQSELDIPTDAPLDWKYVAVIMLIIGTAVVWKQGQSKQPKRVEDRNRKR
jgi:hypothetical protein